MLFDYLVRMKTVIVGFRRYPNVHHQPSANGCGSYGIEVCILMLQNLQCA